VPKIVEFRDELPKTMRGQDLAHRTLVEEEHSQTKERAEQLNQKMLLEGRPQSGPSPQNLPAKMVSAVLILSAG